jgi:transposase
MHTESVEMEVEEDLRCCHWVGMDVAKSTFDAAWVRAEQHYPYTPLRELPVRTFARSPEGVDEFLAWLDELGQHGRAEQCNRVCMEATGSYSTELTVWLLDKRPSLEPAIVNPAHTSAFIKSMGLRNKTDKLEARALGFYGVERGPVAYEPLTPDRAELRELSRYRDSLVRQKVAESNQAGARVTSRAVMRLQNKRIRLLRRDIEKVEMAMKAIVGENPELKRDVKQLTAIYGVGFITAVVVLAELGDLRRFKRARQLSAFAGLSPRVVESGSSVNGRPRLCKQGNSRVRQALYLAALTVIRGRSDLQDTYCRLLEHGKAPKAALGAIMRKLLVLMRAILISGKPYEAYHKTCG